MTNQFNFEDAVKGRQSGQKLNGKDGVLTSLIKQLTESVLQAELEQHLANEQEPNRKNALSLTHNFLTAILPDFCVN